MNEAERQDQEAERQDQEGRYCALLAAEKKLIVQIRSEFSVQVVLDTQRLLHKARKERLGIEAVLRKDDPAWMPECRE